jgi:hypothetical protein
LYVYQRVSPQVLPTINHGFLGVASPGNEDGPRTGHDGIGIHRIHRLASRCVGNAGDLPKSGGLMVKNDGLMMVE